MGVTWAGHAAWTLPRLTLLAVSTADYQRRWRAKHGAKTGEPGRPVTASCGTPSAWKRHQRKGEPIDKACADAWAAYQRELYAKRKGRQ